jgi:hypothetical protein
MPKGKCKKKLFQITLLTAGIRACSFLRALQIYINIQENGSPGRIRTSDQLINSQLRYRCATGENLIREKLFTQSN